MKFFLTKKYFACSKTQRKHEIGGKKLGAGGSNADIRLWIHKTQRKHEKNGGRGTGHAAPRWLLYIFF